MKNHKTVSILTITQYDRYLCLPILLDLIKSQTYKNITEWIIVEGSKTKEKAELNKQHITKLMYNAKAKFNIKYIEFVENSHLGGLRNRSNDNATGDILVCMDDDDYYFPTRVEHCVKRLSKSNKSIAGATNIYMHDYITEKTIELNMINTHGPNHSTNNAFAYKKEYLKNHRYDDNKDFAEEASFTNNFTEPMIQLDKNETLILSSHQQNTFNKREIVTNIAIQEQMTGKVVDDSIKYLMKKSLYDRYRNIFIEEVDSPYDIVYFAGGHSIMWDPEDKSLGGSEQAIVNLSNNWAKAKKVAVYGNFNFTLKTVDNVDYYNWKTFPYNHRFNIIIGWRLFGLLCMMPFNIKAKHKWLDLHDNMKHQKRFIDMITTKPTYWDKIFFKSEYHQKELENILGYQLKKEQAVIIPNGLRIEPFMDNTILNSGKPIERNPYRMCYASCYTRGLENILTNIFPIIKKLEPKAELHCYYGMKNVPDKKFVERMTQLLKQDGVYDHGRQQMPMIIREKYLSTFHLYLSFSEAEIDCISIRESLITGCIPIMTTFGVFANRDGVHYNWNGDPRMAHNIAQDIVNKMRDDKFISMAQDAIKKSHTIIGWDKVGDMWLKNC